MGEQARPTAQRRSKFVNHSSRMRIEFEMNSAVRASELTKNLRHSPAPGRRPLRDRKSAIRASFSNFRRFQAPSGKSGASLSPGQG
jgi:hypothetical protein